MEEKDTKNENPVKEKKEEKKVAEETKKQTKKEEPKKKTDNSKEKSKKTKEIMIGGAIVAGIVLIIVVSLLVMADSPKKALNTMLTEIKSGDIKEEEIAELLEEEDFNEETRKAIFENLSWKILNEKKEGNTATLEVEITNKDFAKIIENFKEKIVKVAFSGESIDEAKTQEYLLAEINNEEIENVTNTHSITVEKQDGKWKVSDTNDMINILLPGFSEAINSLY